MQYRLNEFLYGTVLIAFVVEIALRRWALFLPHEASIAVARPPLSALETQRQS